MEIAYTLRNLWRLRLWVIVAAVVALVGSVAITQRVSLFPPSLHSKQGIEGGAASTSLLVDSPHSAIGNINSPLDPLAARAALIALLTKSDPVQRQIEKKMGISPKLLSTTVTIPNPYSPSLPSTLSAGARANALIGETAPYQISTQPELSTPIVEIYTQAPSGKEAIALANATSESVRHYLTRLQEENAVPRLSRVDLRTLGDATGGNVNSGAGTLVLLLAFVGIFVVGCLIVLGVSRVAHDIRVDRDLDELQSVGLKKEPTLLQGPDSAELSDEPPDFPPSDVSTRPTSPRLK